MPVPILRRYGTSTIPAAVTTAVTPVVPAARALVISKLIINNLGSVGIVNFALYAGPSGNNAETIAYSIPFSPGDIYTESGLVLLAGEAIRIYVFGTVANILSVVVHGEEVDN